MTRPRQISNKQLLEAARAVFLEHGPSVSTTTIANHAGVSQAVLFQRFGTKEKLMVEALAPPEESVAFSNMAKGPDERGMKHQLRELAHIISQHFERIFPAMMVLKSAGVCHDDIFSRYEVPPPIRGHLLVSKWFEAALGQGKVVDIDPSSVATAFIGAIQSRVFLSHLGGGSFPAIERDQYLTWMVDFFWRGMRPRSTQ